MRKKILGGAVLTATLLAVLTGCAPRHYEEIHGKVLNRTTEDGVMLMSTGESMVAVPTTDYYLLVHYRDSGGKDAYSNLQVSEVSYASCWKGLNFERSEDGTVSCTVPGAENLDKS